MKNLVALLTILSMVVTPCLAQCANETAALLSNQGLVDANAEMGDMLLSAIDANPLEFCDVFSATCTFNLQDYSSNVDSNCTAQDGQLAERTVIATCNGTVSQVPIPDGFTITVNNAPLCVGASCDVTAIPSELEEQFKTVIDVLVEELNMAIGAELMCSVAIANGGGATPAPTPGGGDTTPAPTSGGGDTTPAPTSSGGGTTPAPTSDGGDTTPAPTSDGGGTAPILAPTSGGGDTTPAPTSGGGGTAPTLAPTSSGVQSTTILVTTAVGIPLLSFVLM